VTPLAAHSESCRRIRQMRTVFKSDLDQRLTARAVCATGTRQPRVRCGGQAIAARSVAPGKLSCSSSMRAAGSSPTQDGSHALGTGSDQDIAERRVADGIRHRGSRGSFAGAAEGRDCVVAIIKTFLSFRRCQHPHLTRHSVSYPGIEKPKLSLSKRRLDAVSQEILFESKGRSVAAGVIFHPWSPT
jgi:hypothetical protein